MPTLKKKKKKKILKNKGRICVILFKSDDFVKIFVSIWGSFLVTDAIQLPVFEGGLLRFAITIFPIKNSKNPVTFFFFFFLSKVTVSLDASASG